MARIESHRQQNFLIGSVFDDYFQITQLPAKAPWKFIKNPRNFFSKFVVIQQP